MVPGYNYPFAVFADGFYLCFRIVDEFHPVREELPAHFAKLFFEVLGHPFHVECAFAFFEAGSAFVAVFCGGYVDGSAGGADVEEAYSVGYCISDPFLGGYQLGKKMLSEIICRLSERIWLFRKNIR